jgi:hypothetical protein
MYLKELVKQIYDIANEAQFAIEDNKDHIAYDYISEIEDLINDNFESIERP